MQQIEKSVPFSSSVPHQGFAYSNVSYAVANGFGANALERSFSTPVRHESGRARPLSLSINDNRGSFNFDLPSIYDSASVCADLVPFGGSNSSSSSSDTSSVGFGDSISPQSPARRNLNVLGGTSLVAGLANIASQNSPSGVFAVDETILSSLALENLSNLSHSESLFGVGFLQPNGHLADAERHLNAPFLGGQSGEHYALLGGFQSEQQLMGFHQVAGNNLMGEKTSSSSSSGNISPNLGSIQSNFGNFVSEESFSLEQSAVSGEPLEHADIDNPEMSSVNSFQLNQLLMA